MKNDDIFPQIGYGELGTTCSKGGLTKRELFAAMAMQGILSNSKYSKEDHVPIVVAADSMRLADVLLKKLSSTKETLDDQREEG